MVIFMRDLANMNVFMQCLVKVAQILPILDFIIFNIFKKLVQ